ncbi:hypothetical protein A1O3_09484 [Capronia epimyces CBS 606.96]|uniref:Uncharacterized protein n=1 Tax=Capronia epimyces CBS 606.96 TaxID=1182542 RepID=W9XDM9_9EURO|nr:uncharacterized protein A1O3_09484 [Capronia epimyces CBS 606.96]EXJ78323.1 hypothetical protein A1O3_09484 [Capronia epimyces CBS 606.96]
MSSQLGLRLHPPLHQRSSFWSIFHAQEFTYTVSNSLLTSPTFHVINPLNHDAKGDKVSVSLPIKAVSGLGDEEILALLTKGFFGGWVFAIEGWAMRACGGILPAAYTGFKANQTASKRIIWKSSDISEDSLVPIGDMLFDFALVSKHIQTRPDSIPPSSSYGSSYSYSYSYVDYGFGSDQRNFAGAHRFVVTRKEQDQHQHQNQDQDSKEQKEEEYIELSIECFRCNPLINQDSWAEYLPWLHYWYARFLWAEAVRTVLRHHPKAT